MYAQRSLTLYTEQLHTYGGRENKVKGTDECGWYIRADKIEELGDIPDTEDHGAIMGPTWDRQDPGGPHVGPMNLAIWDRDK